MSNNSISIVGTVATEPRLVKTASGLQVCSFRLASGERRFDREQQKWVDGETNWVGVTAFRSLAEHTAASFRKGERVIVSGRLRVRKWENDEKSGTSVEVEADALGHDLRWGVSRFEKRTGPTESGSATAEGGSEPGDTGTADDGVTVDGATSNGEPSRDGFMPLAA